MFPKIQDNCFWQICWLPLESFSADPRTAREAMAPLKKSVDNKKLSKKASNKAERAMKIGLKKTSGAASKKRPNKASKKMLAPAKKSKIVTVKKTSRSLGNTFASDQGSSKAGPRIPKKKGQKKTASALKKFVLYPKKFRAGLNFPESNARVLARYFCLCIPVYLYTLDLYVTFGYLEILGTFWIPWTFRYLLDTWDL